MYVYLVTNRVNGKMYVGITSKTPEQRWQQHVASSKLTRDIGMPIVRAIRKYGIDSFNVSVLETCSTFQQLCEAERRWIEELKTFGEHGYNATVGGEGTCGRIVSDETRARLSFVHRVENLSCETRRRLTEAAKKRYDAGHGELMKSRRRRGKDHPRYGKPWSNARKGPLREETRKKISTSHRGKRLSDEHKASISAALKGKRGPNLGRKFSCEQRQNISTARHMKKKPIFGFDVNGEWVITYLSLKDAMKSTLLGYRTLAGCRKKRAPKFIDGVTYRRSDRTIEELRKEHGIPG